MFARLYTSASARPRASMSCRSVSEKEASRLSSSPAISSSFTAPAAWGAYSASGTGSASQTDMERWRSNMTRRGAAAAYASSMRASTSSYASRLAANAARSNTTRQTSISTPSTCAASLARNVRTSEQATSNAAAGGYPNRPAERSGSATLVAPRPAASSSALR